jgi:two-component system, cell cycle response regulator
VSASGLPRVMIVDDSRIVRATVIKRIRDRFDVREETDGEAGWEALLVDPSIQLVITDHSMPRLDGYGLIERIRASKVGRIRDLPVIMISGDEDEESRQRAKDVGATDFITKGTGTAELLARLDALVELGRSHEALAAARAAAATDPATGLLTSAMLLRQAEQMYSYARRHGTPVCALVIGLDCFDQFVAAEGRQLADALLSTFARVLAGKVRKEDCLARWGSSLFAVVTPGIDTAQAHLFAERLRAAVAGASIHHQDRTLQVTVSIGLAGYRSGGEESPEALLAAAERCMAEGVAAGGNSVFGSLADPAMPEAAGGADVDAALRHIAAGRTVVIASQLPELGLRLLPLLRLIDDEFQLELPLAEMERRLAERNKDGVRQDQTGVMK